MTRIHTILLQSQSAWQAVHHGAVWLSFEHLCLHATAKAATCVAAVPRCHALGLAAVENGAALVAQVGMFQ